MIVIVYSRECLGHHRKGTPGIGNVYETLPVSLPVPPCRVGQGRAGLGSGLELGLGLRQGREG